MYQANEGVLWLLSLNITLRVSYLQDISRRSYQLYRLQAICRVGSRSDIDKPCRGTRYL